MRKSPSQKQKLYRIVACGQQQKAVTHSGKNRGLIVVGTAQAKAPGGNVRYSQPRITLPLYRRTVSLDTLHIPADSDSSPCLDVRDVTSYKLKHMKGKRLSAD
jgi:hypothetical protein